MTSTRFAISWSMRALSVGLLLGSSGACDEDARWDAITVNGGRAGFEDGYHDAEDCAVYGNSYSPPERPRGEDDEREMGYLDAYHGNYDAAYYAMYGELCE